MLFKKFRFSGLLVSTVSLFFLVNSCEVANDLIGNATVAKLEGEWTCEENSEYFKKSTSSAYSITISADADNPDGIIIDGFYNLGDVGVKANVTPYSISIPSQPAGNVTILTGTGAISSNYKQITWSYNINIGGTAVDHVTAVYTKVN
jgi:hypothetical protein